ncbi:hypothetical protein JQC67_03920 [Aurantibacter crassamenti]|uniref:DUF5687 family protein n=1 Tax=Aurantibacter crassamenti TaxID=1837375 RepID=UPI00193AB04D|nr:DUF5687 family protein [Aurantibacter crassamenti]MBM1105281.1 hypothetical protein [Aurantibacter crassamenti]
MFKRFASLQWKAFFRSSSLGKSLAIKIIMIFFGIYMLACLVLMGVGLFFILEKTFPGVDPMLKVSSYFLYWILGELVFRYFMQKLPVIDIKPFLLMSIKKDSIVHYILGRSAFSFFNFLALFLFVPFGIVLLIKGYPALNVLVWLFVIACISQFINFLNFIINKSDKVLLGLLLVLITFYAVDYFQLYPIQEIFGNIFYQLYANPIWAIIPLVLAILTYAVNYRFLRNKLYLDSAVKEQVKEAETAELGWTKRFGSIAPFLQLDLKLIWRNKRTKTQVFMSLLMILYGLFFYSQDVYGSTSAIFAFVGIFITGIFMVNFGQFIPAWDSEYYTMLMAQNIPMRKYLDSKAGLIYVSIVVMFLLSIPYVYFGWQALAINFACAIYNLGVNVPVVLFFGSRNKKRIDLQKSALGNMQGASATQFLVILPLMVLPCLIYFLFDFFISFEVATAALAVLGLIGLAFRNKLLDKITSIYRSKKYGMIAGFSENN